MSKETTEKKKPELRYFHVKKSVIYKKAAHRPGTVIVTENHEDDEKLKNLMAFASDDALDTDSHLLELTEDQVKKSRSITQENLWFEFGIDGNIINYVKKMVPKKIVEEEE